MRRLLASLLLACAFGAHAAPAVVQGLVHGSGPEAQRFPWVRTDDAKVTDRINQFLFIDTFEAMAPARAAEGLRGVDAQNWQRMPNLGYAVLRNDARVLSLRLEGEGCGAYCESFTAGHAFDVATGAISRRATCSRPRALPTSRARSMRTTPQGCARRSPRSGARRAARTRSARTRSSSTPSA
ncbi:hypothetical protein [Variovorax sp. IB41]|uniref:hypothetical protein n=1 Tax=Variovorax sp. IB41 TaxID=2779370 RepID=UPI0018E8B98D|nr:hypothetical protein [Variovorax sp. IB41]MBJ2159992.1 hypothetical protein [Variovorax sp. IB41]